MAKRRIVVLTSTKPLRERVQDIGRTVEVLSPQKCADLAEKFDMIIIGSRASDDFFEGIKQALPRKLLVKFRLYSRSFFNRYRMPGTIPTGQDNRDQGWQEILRANKVPFVTNARILGDDYKYTEKTFRWKNIEAFITDPDIVIMKA